MSQYRIQRFTPGEDVTMLDAYDEPPPTGWAIQVGGFVYKDGRLVGKGVKMQIGSPTQPRNYRQIEYTPVEGSDDADLS